MRERKREREGVRERKRERERGSERERERVKKNEARMKNILSLWCGHSLTIPGPIQ